MTDNNEIEEMINRLYLAGKHQEILQSYREVDITDEGAQMMTVIDRYLYSKGKYIGLGKTIYGVPYLTILEISPTYNIDNPLPFDELD